MVPERTGILRAATEELKCLPPNVTPYGYHGREESVSRLAALKNVNLTISRITDDYIVLSDCDMICNIDLNDIIKQHIAENANITIAVKSLVLAGHREAQYYRYI